MSNEFYEQQKFGQRWLWVLILLCAAAAFVVFGRGIVEQLFFDRPWGDRPMSNSALVIVSAGVFLFVGIMIFIFYTLRLVTRVNPGGVFVRFEPFMGTLIAFAEIRSCEARSYRPLPEYGGWGIKYGLSGKAYNISGNRGVQLVLKDGKRILIGSQRADELAATINSHKASAQIAV